MSVRQVIEPAVDAAVTSRRASRPGGARQHLRLGADLRRPAVIDVHTSGIAVSM